MVNIDDFAKRIEIVLEYYTLNASAFADKIGVQRSSMSHLLSGRNKPSLDFVMKILEVFPEVDLYWLLSGQGNFPKNEENSSIENSNQIPPISSSENFTVQNSLFYGNSEENKKDIKLPSEVKIQNFNSEESEIEKIVIFYKNGKFKSYLP